MKHRYAQLNENDICVAVVDLLYTTIDNRLIPVETTEVIGKKYVGGEWVENDSESEIAEPTQLDKIEANLDYLVLLNS